MGVFTNYGSKPLVGIELPSLSQEFTNVVGLLRHMLANMPSFHQPFPPHVTTRWVSRMIFTSGWETNSCCSSCPQVSLVVGGSRIPLGYGR